MNLSAVAALPSRPVASVWYRAVRPQHLCTSLNYRHTHLFPSRYCEGPTTATPFDTLYLAENPLVAQFEVNALLGSPLDPSGLIPNPAGSWLIINAQVQLSRVADLTDGKGSQIPLSTTAQELTGDWRSYRQRPPFSVAPTQELGAALYNSALFEGFLTFSSKLPYHLVLAVFPERIAQANYVRYHYQDCSGQPQMLQVPELTTAPSPQP